MDKPDSTTSHVHDTKSEEQERAPDANDQSLRTRVLANLSWVVLLGIALLTAIAWFTSEAFRTFGNDAWAVLSSGDQERIREYLLGFGTWGPVVSVSLMVLQVILAPIPASVVQLANGVVFGIPMGTLLNFIGQMIGATVAFFISRSLGRSAAERLIGRIDDRGVVEQWLARWSGKALFVIRVVPGMPGDFVSYIMGLTKMPARKYILISAIGFAPQSLAYAWLGDAATHWFWWIVLGGFVMSSVFALVVWIMRKKRGQHSQPGLATHSVSDSC